MKIGFSFGRCVGSIVREEVNIEDVMLIVARTHMTEVEHVEEVIQQYLGMPGYLYGLDADRCLNVGLDLWWSGRIIEPRANGVRTMRVPSDQIWMDLYPSVPACSDAVKEAWDAYRMLITLTEQMPEPNSDIFLSDRMNY